MSEERIAALEAEIAKLREDVTDLARLAGHYIGLLDKRVSTNFDAELIDAEKEEAPATFEFVEAMKAVKSGRN